MHINRYVGFVMVYLISKAALSDSVFTSSKASRGMSFPPYIGKARSNALNQETATASVQTKLRGNRNLNIFLPDNRKVASASIMDSYPYRTVGVFQNSDTICTATLVGPNVVATGRRCLQIRSGSLPNNFFRDAVFEAAYVDGTAKYSVQFDYATWTDVEDGIAYLRLVESIGNVLGWVGIVFTDLEYFSTSQNLNYLGYSVEDLSNHDSAIYVEDCSSRGSDGKHVLHDCDTSEGTGGALLLTSLSDQSSNLPFAVAMNNGKDGTAVLSSVVNSWTNDDSNFAFPLKPSLDLFLEILEKPTASPTPFPTPKPTPLPTPNPSVQSGCSTFTCPPNSKANRECTTKLKHCTCDDGFEKVSKTESCEPCSTFDCPPNSMPNRECTTKLKHCTCDAGFEANDQSDSCEPCNTYTCPSNSQPDPKKSCITKFDNCNCDAGFEADKGTETCVNCNTYTCPNNSIPDPKKACVTKFDHCNCNVGFEADKKSETCEDCNTFTCPPNSIPDERQCIKKFKHCTCEEGYKKKDGSCVED